MNLVEPPKLKKTTLAVGASSGIAVYIANFLCAKFNIPEYSTEVTAILTAVIGIVAGLLEPRHSSN